MGWILRSSTLRQTGWGAPLRLWRGAVDLLFPAQCVSCRAVVADASTLCGACWRQMPFITRPFCERLGSPFAVDIGGMLLSPTAIADPPVFERARSVAGHDGIARTLVHQLKFHDRQDLALAMGALMHQAGGELLADADLIVPIPLHWTRRWTRRFNQSRLLAGVVARHAVKQGIDGVPVVSNLLHRRKRTKQQIGLSKIERQNNLQGAFVVPEERKAELEGRRVLLIDDVLTTGSTANAAARILLRSGAKSVDLLTFSRVVNSV
jgi:ComF family protein